MSVAPVGDSLDTLPFFFKYYLKYTHFVLEFHYSKFNADEPLQQLHKQWYGRGTADAKLIGINLGLMLRSKPFPISVYGQFGSGITRGTGQTFSEESMYTASMSCGVHIPITSSVAVEIDIRRNLASVPFSLSPASDDADWMPITASVVIGL